MVEIEKNYKIYAKKFGYVNWIGFWTLYKKEVLRFLIVAIQTVISPLVTCPNKEKETLFSQTEEEHEGSQILMFELQQSLFPKNLVWLESFDWYIHL